MALCERDTGILRGLAKRLAEVAALPVQQEKAELWRRLNALERTRPLILLQNATWHETGWQIECACEDEWARRQEWGLRARLYHWEQMKDDHVYEAKAYAPVAVRDTGMGIVGDHTEPDHVFGAKHFNCVLADDADPEMIRVPEVTVDWEVTERTRERMEEVYGGILEVEPRGVAGHWFAIMDQFITWRDIDRMFVDMVDRPQWVHGWMDRMTEWHLSRLNQLEALGALSLNNSNNGVGPGGLGYTDELPQPDFNGTVRTRDQWAHATTQIFSLVSPAMHEEFALPYEKRFLDRFGLAGYGCCEPLHHKVGIIREHIPHVRRISMSPWADVAAGAEALGDEVIFSYKPNPAVLGGERWDVDRARAQLADAFEKTRGCVVEVLMKDLHEVRNEPRRMWEWVEMAMALAEEYA